MNFLIHNMCRLPGSDGTWMIVKGGMGSISSVLAEKAISMGVKILLNNKVKKIEFGSVDGNMNHYIRGVRMENGNVIRSNIVLVNADPFSMRELIGRKYLSPDYNLRLDNYERDGTTLKIMFALKDLPKLTCLPIDKGQWSTTIHLLPQGQDVIEVLKKSYEDVQQGKLPECPAIE